MITSTHKPHTPPRPYLSVHTSVGQRHPQQAPAEGAQLLRALVGPEGAHDACVLPKDGEAEAAGLLLLLLLLWVLRRGGVWRWVEECKDGTRRQHGPPTPSV